ncbi:MAG TPA: hypothetical protein VFV33_10420 [Gemmatimonadaceae bacterium]|nr:hypothetical protein [Gemmatimonadaceae bacterium]
MPRLVALVHGMGVHPPGWSAAIQETLDQVSAPYAFFDGAPFRTQVTFAEVAYDDVFVSQVSTFAMTADALEAFAQAQGVDIASTSTWLRHASRTEQNFFWSHCVDVLLYRFFPSIREAAIARVRTQLATAIARARQEGPTEVTVIAHSLGTAVAHDALHSLGSRAFDGSKAFKAGTFQLQSLFMLANTSRCLETAPTVHQSCVFPGTLGKGAYTEFYANVRHTLDPVPAVRPFGPAANWKPSRFVAIDTLDHIRDLNVHGFEHYLDHPLVHIPLLRRVFGGSAVTADEETRALKQYPLKPSPPCPDRVRQMRDRYRQMVDLLAHNENPAALIIAAAQFLAAAKEAQDACMGA